MVRLVAAPLLMLGAWSSTTGPGAHDPTAPRVVMVASAVLLAATAVLQIRSAPGLGIGLSIVAAFAELHGGRAWVEDRPGGGSSFRITLPGPTTEAATPPSDGPGVIAAFYEMAS